MGEGVATWRSGTPVATTLRVLHLLAPAPMGGLETVVRTLTQARSRAGGPVRVCPIVSATDSPHPFVESLGATPVDVHPLIVPDHSYLREYQCVRRALEDYEPDIVHTHGYRADVLSGLAAMRARVPLVSTVHGFVHGDWKNRVYEWLQRRIYRRFDAVIAVSRPQVDVLTAAGVPSDRIRVIPNAWEPEVDLLPVDEARDVLGLREAPFVVGWVGRLSPEKGPDVLLHALARLSNPEIHVAFVGEGSQKKELRRLAEDLGVVGSVTWAGAVPQASRVFSAFDTFVLSSRREGTPMVLLEAMAAGVPTVASSVGGVPDVLGNTGWLVPPEEPGALAESLREVWREPGEAQRRSKLAKERLRECFGVEAWLAAYEEIYREVGRSSSRQPLDGGTGKF